MRYSRITSFSVVFAAFVFLGPVVPLIYSAVAGAVRGEFISLLIPFYLLPIAFALGFIPAVIAGFGAATVFVALSRRSTLPALRIPLSGLLIGVFSGVGAAAFFDPALTVSGAIAGGCCGMISKALCVSSEASCGDGTFQRLLALAKAV